MRNVSLEQIVLLLILILAPLINLVLQRARKRSKEQSREESVPEIHREVRVNPRRPPTAAALRTRTEGSPVTVISAPRSKTRSTKKSLLGTRRELRRGIIMLTVLGPCRACDPPNA